MAASAPPTAPPDARRRVEEIVRAHGHDTLSFFKLREDKDYLFSADGRAVAAFIVEGGVMMLSADPVGPADALPGLVSELLAAARARRLRVAVFAASEEARALFCKAGLRSFYLGDEAVVEVGSFSLEGRRIRKVRQSCHRLKREGYTIELRALGAFEDDELTELEALSERALAGEPETGFAMEMPSLRGSYQADTLILLARDPDGVPRGFLHFVPCFGRAAMSLSLMRRERGTPNGLTEFMTVRAIELLRERGVEEISLNFATFARWIVAPEKRYERVLGKVVGIGDRWFQIESLYRFNAKFFPRWDQRYLLYSGRAGLPRAALAALWAEGLVPKPRLRVRRTPTETPHARHV